MSAAGDFGADPQGDAPGYAWLAADEALAFESQDHLDRGRGDAKVALHVGFGGRSSDHLGIGVDEGQVLTLLSEARQPIRARPGQLERFDCEYRRNGTANLFIFIDAHNSWRKVKVTDRRAAEDFALCMRELSDARFPEAEKIRVVLDNLSTHSAGALYQTFPPPRPRRGASCAGWSSIAAPGAPAGSTGSKSKSVSCAANASTDASTTVTSSSLKSPIGSASETKTATASNGCSPPTRRAPIQPRPRSHNPCAEGLGR